MFYRFLTMNKVVYNSTLTMDTCGVARGVAWGGVAQRCRSLFSHQPCRAPLPTPVTQPLSRRGRWSPLDTTATPTHFHTIKHNGRQH